MAPYPLLNKILGAPFDAADIILGYQGLPSATGWKIIASKELRASIHNFHSLGALDGKTMGNLGVVDHGTLYGLPLMNIVPNSMQGIFGTNDPVNGFYLGKLLNPDVIMTHIAGRFFGLGHPSADYFSLFPPKP